MPTRRAEGRRRRSGSTGESGSRQRTPEKTPDGFCTKVYPSGDRYEGNYMDGKRAGWGYYLWGTGDKYVGNWFAGVMHGSGTFTWATGDVYKGKWEMGKATGIGLKVTTDGTNIEGSFVDGLAQGWTRKSFHFGDTYCGMCRSSLREGYGEYTWQCGDKYVGMWLNDVAVGPGIFTISRRVPSGTSEVVNYSGEYRNGNRHGRGCATFTDGSKYSGDWTNGKCHGWGRSTWSSLMSEDVVAASLVLSEGNRSGRRAGRYTSTDVNFSVFDDNDRHDVNDGGDTGISGELYEGSFVDGVREGQGYQERIHIRSDRSNALVQCFIETYSGHWENDSWSGWGVLSSPDGETFRGEFLEGHKHGYGELSNELEPRSESNPKCGTWIHNSFSHASPPP